MLIDELNDRSALAHGGGDAFHRPVADITDGEDAGDVRSCQAGSTP
jgi:hypothetical protein